MPPTARKTTTTAKKQADDLDALRAEVAVEQPAAATDDYDIVPIGDTAFRVKKFLDWPGSAGEFLAIGRFSMWAHKALHPDDVQHWVRIDPTNRQLVEFYSNWEKISGIPLGSMFASLMS